MRKRFLIAACGCLLAYLVAAFSLLSSALSQPRDDPRNYQTIAVLFADASHFGPRSRRALRAARNIAPSQTHYLCIGGARARAGYYGSQAMAEWLVADGVSAERITVDTNSFDSVTNLDAIRRWQNEHPEPVLIVTDALHARRLRNLVELSTPSGLGFYPYDEHALRRGKFRRLFSARTAYEMLAIAAHRLLSDKVYRAAVWRYREYTFGRL